MNKEMIPVKRHRPLLRGNQAAELVSALNLDASKIQNEASAKHLQNIVAPDPLPSFLKIEMFWITSLFPPLGTAGFSEERHAEILEALSLDEDDDPEDEDIMSTCLMKAFFKLLRLNNSDYFTTLMITNSLMCILSPNFRIQMDALFGGSQTASIDISLYEFINRYPIYQRSNPFSQKEYLNITPSHYTFRVCLLLNLIGKGLNSNNYSGWMAQRTRSYTVPLGLTETDKHCRFLRPSEIAAVQFNNEVKTDWRHRRLYFQYIWAFSRRDDILARGCQITINLLRNAELTNVAMIFVWIGTLNNILLGWHELAKYVPYLCSAYAKFKAVGPLAPWCKLILPPSEVVEFGAEKLRLPFSIAKAIASKYGSSTVDQLEGANKNPVTDRIIEQALKIIAYSGGARTIDTMAVRIWKLDGYENPLLIRELDTGALEVPVRDLQEEDPNIEQRLVVNSKIRSYCIYYHNKIGYNLDCVDHSLLLYKLGLLGIGNKVLDLLYSYLSCR